MGDETTAVAELYAPEYGPIRRLFEYVLCYVVVDRLTELLVGLFEEIPMFAAHVPTLQLASTVGLVVVLVVVVLWELRRQYVANPVSVEDLGSLRPSSRRLAVAGGALTVGAGVVVHGWGTVRSFTGDPDVLLSVTEEMLTAASSSSGGVETVLAVLGTDIGVLAAFTGGFVLLAYGIDRLLIGLAREVLYRRHPGSR